MKIFLIAIILTLATSFSTVTNYNNFGSSGKVAGWPVRWHIETANDFGKTALTPIIFNYGLAFLLNFVLYLALVYAAIFLAKTLLKN